jgi:hypothetical protein
MGTTALDLLWVPQTEIQFVERIILMMNEKKGILKDTYQLYSFENLSAAYKNVFQRENSIFLASNHT